MKVEDDVELLPNSKSGSQGKAKYANKQAQKN